jgi:hypothetical protein
MSPPKMVQQSHFMVHFSTDFFLNTLPTDHWFACLSISDYISCMLLEIPCYFPSTLHYDCIHMGDVHFS